MARSFIKNVRPVLPDRLLGEHGVLVEQGRIAGLVAAGEPPDLRADEVVDGEGRFLSPGFIDLHCHGVHEWRTDLGPAHLGEMCRILPRYGVTGFLPTLIPGPKEQGALLVASLAGVISEGAHILGFHFEGPFVTRPGAMPPEALGAADEERVRTLIAAASPYRAVFSIAPEFEGILNLIPIMAQGRNPVFVTHTRASVEETLAAIGAGVSHATHFYDVFPCPPEQDPGVRPCGAVEAILASPQVTVDFILDGEHVHPIALQLALRCKGPGGVCLITDANVGAGLPPGKAYRFGSREIVHHYEGGPARIVGDDPLRGALAGSGLTMDRAVRNALRMLRAELPLAVRMASANPAGVLGLNRRKGRIEQGYDADLVLLDDNLEVVQTWVAGICRFRRRP